MNSAKGDLSGAAADRLNRGVIAALGAIITAMVFGNAAYHVDLLLREPDLWWHIKSGLTMFATHAVPQVDTFSHSHAGHPWIAKEWLAQVIYAASWQALGWAGPLFVAAAAIALTAWLYYQRASRDMRPFAAAVLVLLGVFMTQGVTVARPHVLTFPLAIALTVLTFDAARGLKSPPWWSLLLTVLWTNLHGSFALAFLISGSAFLDYLERSRLKDWAMIARWLAYLALSVLATLVNPYFIKPYIIAFELARGIGVMDHISEWAPFTQPDNKLLELGFLAFFAVLLKARAKFTFGQIIFALMAFHMMLAHLRFIYLLFLPVPLALLPEVVEAMPTLSLAGWAQGQRDALERLVGRNASTVQALVLLAVLGYGGWLAQKGHVVPPEGASVASAIAYVQENQASHPALQKKVFNDYNMGGPLILAGIKTYVDGRAEQLFLGDFMTQYLDSGEEKGLPEFQKILSDTEIGWALLNPKDPRAKYLATQPDWQKDYGDSYAEVWERKG